MRNELLKLIQSDPKTFLRKYQSLYAKILMLKNELDFAKETDGDKLHMQACLNELKQAQADRTAIFNFICAHVTDERKCYILCAHYLQGLAINDIAQQLNITRRWCNRLQEQAIDELTNSIAF